VLIALTFLAAVAVVTATMVRYARANAAKALVERGATISSIVSRAAARAADKHATRADVELALDRVIYDVRAEKGLEFAYIVDADQRAVAHSSSLRKNRQLPDGLPRGARRLAPRSWPEEGFSYVAYMTSAHDGSVPADTTVYEFARTVRLSEKAKRLYGGDLELHMGFSLPGLWPFALASLKRAAPGLAVAFLLLIAGNYLAGVVVRPLQTLRNETAEAAGAEEDWNLEMEGSGEIAEIATNWNRMVQNFRSSYQRVVEARRELEVRNRVMLYEKKRTEAIVDSLSDGVMVTDGYGKVSFVNREFENLFGLERDAVQGRSPEDFLEDDSVAEFVQTVLNAPGAGFSHGAARSKKNQKRAADVEVTRPNGTRHLRLTYVPVLEKGDKPGAAITTLRDITQAKLEETARKEFVSSVTHELRAPLTAIKSYVEMLIDDEAKDPELQREFFNTINEEADRLARLINDMLNMSKIEVGNLVLNKSLVRTRKLLQDAVNGVRSAAKSKSIQLGANIDEDLPDVEADKEMVRVVVTNLLGNGIKYTPMGGEVYLSAERQDDASASGPGHIAVTVTDNGPGIPEDEQAKIFQKFYRGRDTAKQKVVGNGLGLALAREIATLHGGDIKVESQVGEGSKFTFLLPAAETSRKVS
jgi:PAS domain S-box-containing protein